MSNSNRLKREARVISALAAQGIEPNSAPRGIAINFDYNNETYAIFLNPPRLGAMHSCLWGPCYEYEKVSRGWDQDLFDWIQTLVKPLPANVIPLKF